MSLSSVKIKIVVPTVDAENAILGNLKLEAQSYESMAGPICGSVCMPPSVCRGTCATCACNSRQDGVADGPKVVAFSN
jgi:hypothetical protein